MCICEYVYGPKFMVLLALMEGSVAICITHWWITQTATGAQGRHSKMSASSNKEYLAKLYGSSSLP